MFRSIGHGHQPVAQLSRPTLCRTQGSLLILALVVFRAGIHVFLAVAQHGIDEPGQLVGGGGDGLGRAPRWAFFRRRKAPRALSERCSALAARRKVAAARLALGLVFELMTRPPARLIVVDQMEESRAGLSQIGCEW